jgi:transmembrane sensor
MTVSSSIPDDRAQTLRDAQNWLVRLTSGRATPKDAEAFRLWCAQSAEHAEAFAETRQMWRALGPAAESMARSAGPRAGADSADTDIWQPRGGWHAAGRRSAYGLSVGERRLGRRVFLGGGLAALAAYAVVRPPLGLWPSLFDMEADYRTATGEQRLIRPADGLIVEMNTQTALNVRQDARGIELLTGEAEIVARASAAAPAWVQARNGLVSAVDARFNVRLDDDSVCVTCLDGSLQVEVQGQAITVTRARQLTYGASRPVEAAVRDPLQLMAWRDRKLVFDNEPLARVIDEINRYRPGRMVLLNRTLGERKVQARFSLDQLADVATLIQDAYGAKLTSLPGGVVLLS